MTTSNLLPFWYHTHVGWPLRRYVLLALLLVGLLATLAWQLTQGRGQRQVGVEGPGAGALAAMRSGVSDGVGTTYNQPTTTTDTVQTGVDADVSGHKNAQNGPEGKGRESRHSEGRLAGR